MFKKLVLPLLMVCSGYAHAGSQSDIPVELIDLDNQGRVIFIENALAKMGVVTGSYVNLRSIILIGEETAQSESKGAVIGYYARVYTKAGAFNCEETIALGSFAPNQHKPGYSNPIECQPAW